MTGNFPHNFSLAEDEPINICIRHMQMVLHLDEQGVAPFRLCIICVKKIQP